MAIAGSLTYDTEIEKDGFEKGVKSLQTNSVAAGNVISDAFSSIVNKVKDFTLETINVGKQFDSSMSQVSAVSGATGKDLDRLRDKAKEMGASTKFTASEAADAFNYMAMAGWKSEEMLNGIDGVLNLAAASGADLATTSDIVTDALTAMGYSAGEAGRLADVMAAASSNANTNVEMMGETFKYAAPVAGSLGYSMEDTAVAIGLMANAGIKGSQAGTALRSIMSRLSTDAGASSKQLGALGILTKKLGVEFYNADGTTRDFMDVMSDLRVKWKELSVEEQANYGKKIAGQEALSGLLAIMNAAPSDFEKLSSAVENSTGTAQKMADTMQNNLGGDLTKLGSKLEGVQIALYEKLEPALRSGTKALDGLLDVVNFIIDHGTEFISIVNGMATAIGVYLAYTTAMKVMEKGWKSLKVAQMASAAAQKILNLTLWDNPIGLIIAVIAGLVVAFITLWNKSEAFRNFWINLWENVKKIVSSAVEKVKEILNKIINFVKKNWKNLLLFLVNPFARSF